MEFLLLPYHRGDAPVPLPLTPYVCNQRYDGGPFLSYPMRVGKVEADAASFNALRYHRSKIVNPTPINEYESFIQTWLWFGLILELLGVNSPDNIDGIATAESSKIIIDRVYDMLLVPGEGGFNIVLDVEGLHSLLKIAEQQLPEDQESKVKHFDHIQNCLAHAHSILSGLPGQFKHSIKYSIAAFCELAGLMSEVMLSALGVQRFLGRSWALQYLNQDAKDSMMAHGWCPSDIKRAESKFLTVQALHLIRMMDKSRPKRNHSSCTDETCKFYQINSGTYQVGHEEPDCLCEELVVNAHELEEILHKGDCVPLLRLTGDLQQLEVELVTSDVHSTYTAISHVWADGLGNPHANSLHRCKLYKLRKLVSDIHDPDSNGSDPPLIWLDTLCCPAMDGRGKEKALQKIRLVYERAAHVLVLDAGLTAYSSKEQELHEQALRIFTSGWMRRLWTLQEGALARSLYFQFSDAAISFPDLRKALQSSTGSLRHRVVARDTIQEFWSIDAFFKSDEHSRSGEYPNFVVLDQALQFRAVSVASDEPLCIGTLMSLDLASILAVEHKEDRMRKVWELLAKKMGGIPAQVIFLEDKRINAKGWKWAPRSFLSMGKSIHPPNIRINRWGSALSGIPTGFGLKVRFPGFSILVSQYDDGKPRNPWPGLKRIPESSVQVCDQKTGQWYTIADKKYAYISSQWKSDDEQREYNKLELFPLHDIIDSGKALVVMNSAVGGYDVREGILALPWNENDAQAVASTEGTAVTTASHILLSLLAPDYGYIYATIRRLAIHLRQDNITKRHLELYARLKKESSNNDQQLKVNLQESDEFDASMKGLREEMKVITAQVINEDTRFVNAVKTYLGASYLESIWVLIQDWFNHDYYAVQVSDHQVWYIG